MARSNTRRGASAAAQNSLPAEQNGKAGMVEALDRSLAIIEFAMDGTILAANENFLRCMGYSLSETIGQHHSMFVGDAQRNSAAYQEFWAKLAQGEFNAGQFRRLGKGGTRGVAASYIQPDPQCSG